MLIHQDDMKHVANPEVNLEKCHWHPGWGVDDFGMECPWPTLHWLQEVGPQWMGDEGCEIS